MSSLQLNAQQLQVLCDQMVKSPNGINTLLSAALNSLMVVPQKSVSGVSLFLPEMVN